MRQTAIASVRYQSYQDTARRLRDVASQVVERLGCTEVAGIIHVSPPALHMALDGRDNRDVKLGWLAAILDMDNEDTLIRELCTVAGGDFIARDKRTDAEKLAALKEEVAKVGEIGLQMLKSAGLK